MSSVRNGSHGVFLQFEERIGAVLSFLVLNGTVLHTKRPDLRCSCIETAH